MSNAFLRLGRDVNGRDAMACRHMGAWWPEFVRLVRAELGVSLEIIQARGGAAASAGTHRDGTALDLRTWRFTLSVVREIVRLAREAGAPATWYRTRAQGFDPHIHLVLDCDCRSNADYQIAAVKAGFNGLAKGGRGGRDDGPKPSAWRNNVSGLLWVRQRLRALVSGWEEYMAGKTDEDMKKLIVAAIKEFFYDDLAENKVGDDAVDGSRNNALWHAARSRDYVGMARQGVNQALWDPLVEGNEGITGTSVRNVLLHIYATSVAALGAVREIASGAGVELDASVFAEGLPDAVADEVLERLGAAIVKA